MIGVLDHFRELLVGQDPAKIEHWWGEMVRGTFWSTGQVLMSAVAPLLLMIVLVLLVQMMRSRSILTGLAILASVFAMRQQMLRVGPVRALDAGAMTCAAVALVLAGVRLMRCSI